MSYFSEFKYHNITSGSNNILFKSIRNPGEYLHTFRESIAKGAQLTRLAVQEPLGVSIKINQVNHM